MEEKVIKSIEKELSKVILTPFNWEIANYDLQGSDDEDFCYGCEYGSLYGLDGVHFGKHSLSPFLQFMDPIPSNIESDIMNFKPAYICPAGEDSTAQLIGYPKPHATLYKASSRGRMMGISTEISLFNNNCIFVGQCEPCANVSFMLIPMNKYRIAQYFTLDCYIGGPGSWISEEFTKEDYRKYGEEVLGIDFEE